MLDRTFAHGKIEGMRILLVEDSPDVGLLVKVGLKPYHVEQAFSLTEAELYLDRENFDTLLIDIGLPDGSGFEFCQRLTADPRFQSLPKILITGMNETFEIVHGFNCGADDYVVKPFNTAVLKARIDRYFRKKDDQKFSCGNFIFDLNFQKCFVLEDAQQVDLQFTPTEFRIFLTLVKGKGQAFSRKELEGLVWRSTQTFIKARGIDAHIARIRQKLKSRKDVIVSVYGKGYAFRDDIPSRLSG